MAQRKWVAAVKAAERSPTEAGGDSFVVNGTGVPTNGYAGTAAITSQAVAAKPG